MQDELNAITWKQIIETLEFGAFLLLLKPGLPWLEN